MSNSDEPVWRAELPDLTNDFAAILADDAEVDLERATALRHSLARVLGRQAGGLSQFQSVIDDFPASESSADFGSAIG